MKNLKQIIQEKLIINKHSKSKKSYVESLEELRNKYDLEDWSIDGNFDRRYKMSKELSEKFLNFVKQSDNKIEKIITKFTKDAKVYNTTTEKTTYRILSTKQAPQFYYVIINNAYYMQNIAEIIYNTHLNNLRVYISKVAELKTNEINNLDGILAKIIDFILQYEES